MCLTCVRGNVPLRFAHRHLRHAIKAIMTRMLEGADSHTPVL